MLTDCNCLTIKIIGHEQPKLHSRKSFEINIKQNLTFICHNYEGAFSVVHGNFCT